MYTRFLWQTPHKTGFGPSRDWFSTLADSVVEMQWSGTGDSGLKPHSSFFCSNERVLELSDTRRPYHCPDVKPSEEKAAFATLSVGLAVV